MIKILRRSVWPILLLSSSVLLVGCPPQGDTTTESSGDTTTTDTTTSTVYEWLTVTAPNGGETWNPGSTYTITWEKGTHTAANADYVGIKLYDGSGDAGTLIHTILEDPGEEEKDAVKANDGSYSWTIPVDLAIGSNYEIRIKAKDEDGIVEDDESDTAFTISTGGALSFMTPAFSNGGGIPEKYTCDGSETKLTFTISEIPSSAASLVLFIDDLDGSPTSTTTASDWSHWVVFNIPIVSSINAYSLPAGAIEATNDSEDSDYDPICPPGEKGDRKKHTYRFELYAIDTTLNLGPNSKRSAVVTAMKNNLIEKHSFSGYFGTD